LCCLNTEGGVNQHSWLGNGPFQDVFSFEHGDIPAIYVSLPESGKGELKCVFQDGVLTGVIDQIVCTVLYI